MQQEKSAQVELQQPASVFLPEHPAVDQFAQQLFGRLVETTRIANELPEDEEYNYCASFRPFRDRMTDYGKRIASLSQKIVDHQQTGVSSSFYNLELDEIIDRFDSVVDFVDNVIERVDSFADDLTGKPTSMNVTKFQARPATVQSHLQNRQTQVNMFHSNTISRPQLKFEDAVDNTNSPFIPKITRKPNALKPLDESYAIAREAIKVKKNVPKDMESYVTGSLGLKLNRNESYSHPYEHEIDQMVFEKCWPLTTKPETMYGSLEDTPCTYVSRLDQLQELAGKLDRQTEIAIDLENHSYRSFSGFVCLMQISTRNEDFLVDALELRAHLHLLNSSFTNPKIIKVLHGADSDVVWLQRDFGIYLVNLFDTGQAARVLELPSFALAYLLKSYCNINADKKYQLADWRIRPLPEEMLKYAREDTHYLLYIYDMLRNELITRGNASNNLLLAVWNRSKDISKKKYEKELLDDNTHLLLYHKYNLSYNPQQMRAFKEIFKWRDHTAREEDESTRYVLPNHMMFHIAEVLPTEMEALLACCNPVPPLVRINAADLVQIIVDAKREPTEPAKPSSIPKPNLQIPPISIPMNISDKNDEDQETLNSPVLSTDQLYKSAGWFEDVVPEGAYVAKRDILDVDTKGGTLFDSSSDDDDDKYDAYATRDTLTKIQMSFDSPFESSLFAAIMNKKQSKPSQPPPQIVVEESESPKESPKTSPRVFDVLDDKDVAADLDGVPKSMAEIYKLSNRNRKRNKEKKKLKEESINRGSASPVQFEGENNSGLDVDKKNKRARASESAPASVSSQASPTSPSPPNSANQAVQTGKSVEDVQDFMKKIGWITNENMMAAVASSSSSSSSAPSSVVASPTTSSSSKNVSAPLPISSPSASHSSSVSSSISPSPSPSPSSAEHKSRKPKSSSEPNKNEFSGPRSPKHSQAKSPSSSRPLSSQGFAPYDYNAAPAMFNTQAPSNSSPSYNQQYYNPYNEQQQQSQHRGGGSQSRNRPKPGRTQTFGRSDSQQQRNNSRPQWPKK
eukprot:TRINITY_DN8292_c0_g1_i1.p1 TRINITY_DN8292_c0_g1~~TRINITY_DN8292_c0_g1_i1.p1  ORF type:complete len:1022 (-),score=235.38 TRINITY_DN8292_c0_g1_i1:83-3148(-)